MRIAICFFLFLFGCETAPISDLRSEGEIETKKLVMQLRSIETKEELQKVLPALRKRFSRLADLLIELRECSDQEGEGASSSVGEELFIELARIYEMGGRELIEIAQKEAVQKLTKSS